MRAKVAKREEHVVMIGKGVGCLHCGVEEALPYPCRLEVLDAVGKAFTREHRACKPSESGAARFKFMSPEEWLDSWDRGTSSETLYVALTGAPLEGHDRHGVPIDPADFGRCHRLLAVAPDWRARLNKPGTVRILEALCPGWARLVARWDDLERLYEEESPSGSAPKLYALLKELAS